MVTMSWYANRDRDMREGDRFTDDIETSLGLPASAYFDSEFLICEQKHLFAKTWHAIGFTHDVAEPGAVCPVESAAGCALLMVRDQQGVIRVFHNYCRHRGMRLVDQPGKAKRTLVCPYHAWSYALDGSLSRIPHRDGYGGHAECPSDVPGLVEVRTAIWAGIVFVSLSGVAQSFEDYLEPLTHRWADYDFELLRHGISMEFDVTANWKLAIENFIDIYHVPYVHPSLNRYNGMSDHYFIHDGIVIGEGNDRYEPTDEGAGQLPEFPGINDVQRSTIEAVCLFPNLLLTLFSDNLRIILVQPNGPGRCHERVSISFVGDEAMTDALAEHRHIVASRFPAFNDEDMGIVNKLQVAFETSAFERAHFNAFFDGNVHSFQRLVATACENAAP
ncbi:MAG: hypothetical protein CMO26_00915 [Thiotrichales bacterium]|nr:hypothetical protein [Thiotrichales bacterium]